MAAFPSDASAVSQWQIWIAVSHKLLDTPEKAVVLAETIVGLAYGPDQVMEERPFVAEDLGDVWRVKGQGLGAHAIPFFAVSSTITLAKQTGAVLDYTLSRPAPPELLKRLRQ